MSATVRPCAARRRISISRGVSGQSSVSQAESASSLSVDLRVERAAHRAGAAEAGEDQRAAAGQVLVELAGGRQPVLLRQVDVDDRDVRLALGGGGQDVGAGGDLRDDFDVGFEVQQGRERATHHVHVLGQQDSDHPGPPFPQVTLSVQIGRGGVRAIR